MIHCGDPWTGKPKKDTGLQLVKTCFLQIMANIIGKTDFAIVQQLPVLSTK